MPEAASICNNPEFMKDCLIFCGGDTASSPKTIPPKISKLGDLRYLECILITFSRYSLTPCINLSLKVRFFCKDSKLSA